VLEPLSGYIALAEKLYTEAAPTRKHGNFGPADMDARPVAMDSTVSLCIGFLAPAGDAIPHSSHTKPTLSG